MPSDAYWAVAAASGWICALIALAYVRGLAKENAQLRKLIAPFDADGDGKPGGSRKASDLGMMTPDSNINTWGSRLNDSLVSLASKEP
jgi:hypothetical protein